MVERIEGFLNDSNPRFIYGFDRIAFFQFDRSVCGAEHIQSVRKGAVFDRQSINKGQGVLKDAAAGAPASRIISVHISYHILSNKTVDIRQ